MHCAMDGEGIMKDCKICFDGVSYHSAKDGKYILAK